MQIKKFEAKDMTAALNLIKKEFGPDAVILSAKDVQRSVGMMGMLKRPGVEVTAAIDMPFDAALDTVSPPTARRTDRNADPRPNRFRTVVDDPAFPYRQHASTEKTSNRSARQGLWDRLRDQDVEPVLLERIGAVCRPDDGDVPAFRKRLTTFMEQQGVVPLCRRGPVPEKRIIALVGPTGVGKTTTIAKLAAAQAHYHGRTVGLITLDQQRIGAVEHLSIYANIIGSPMATPTNIDEFKAALHQFASKDLVLIDTPGTGIGDPMRWRELKPMLETAEDAVRLLVISAVTRCREMVRTLDTFKEIGIDGLVFTKMDECCTYGGILNLLLKHPVPLAYFTTGQQVPEDIEPASAGKLLELVLDTAHQQAWPPVSESFHTPAVSASHQSGRPGRNASGDAPYCANRHSDIFHRADCASAKQIHARNRIEFERIESVLAKRFKPCKLCLPDVMASLDAVPETAAPPVRKAG